MLINNSFHFQQTIHCHNDKHFTQNNIIDRDYENPSDYIVDDDIQIVDNLSFNKVRFDIYHYSHTKYTECMVNLYDNSNLITGQLPNLDPYDNESLFSTWIVIEDIEDVWSHDTKNKIILAIKKILRTTGWDMDLQTNWEIVIHYIEVISSGFPLNSKEQIKHNNNIYDVMSYKKVTANQFGLDE